ncbi:D-alanyl-D-alanine carboxypeptidase family protein [Citreimonas salinaria]|uniref:D-alanyl-D-alanine carboxypeptidase n=1 Tax=Citreimonas salinaria TaxID=321339 RepID=A0A1H3I3F4_9RHOB|nr:D-alanyl-D-alanine carboxypeptidase family protein [Citreimonas salinaria]SDY21544.1 D-alanyl-D-alanine carboxypeptidase [Citreimonas salinaria]
MTGRHWQTGRPGLYVIAIAWLLLIAPMAAIAAPYAAMVMDARNGEVLHSQNADTRLHPASLTKMMTLYIAFEAVQNGEISMDTVVTVSRNAAAEPPSALGLRTGQRIKLRYLVRAAAVKSANDAATAIGEAISGSEAAFARRMNRTAKALGMTNTTFKNAHGLTESGHLSTARDMTILGRHVLYDYPMYYNLFSRQAADAGIKTVYHTNRRFLRDYAGADGIKTGYTRAAGFNLTASAQKGSERIITTVFGGNSTASRNAEVAKLMDLGFQRAATQVALHRPAKPPYLGNQGDVLVAHGANPASGAQAKTIRVARAAVTRSLRPFARSGAEQVVAPLVAALQTDIEALVADVQVVRADPNAIQPEAGPEAPETVELASLDTAVDAALGMADGDVATDAATEMAAGSVATDAALETAGGATIAEAAVEEAVPAAITTPVLRPVTIAALRDAATPAQDEEIVTRLSTSGGRHWGINLGRYGSRFAAEKILLRTALSETATLDGALRKVVHSNRGFDATFHGLSRDTAELACRRLQARQVTCFMMGPG